MISLLDITVNLIVLPFLQVRDLIHENINQYIGMCIESPNVCIVSIFCTRGSLQVNEISLLVGCDIHVRFLRAISLWCLHVIGTKPSKNYQGI